MTAPIHVDALTIKWAKNLLSDGTVPPTQHQDAWTICHQQVEVSLNSTLISTVRTIYTSLLQISVHNSPVISTINWIVKVKLQLIKVVNLVLTTTSFLLIKIARISLTIRHQVTGRKYWTKLWVSLYNSIWLDKDKIHCY